ncbi:MAG: hypothetical protein M1482_16805 [Chloroflexi bacterium]|nr:hypothetical protein [Chloroflexota bacterium]
MMKWTWVMALAATAATLGACSVLPSQQTAVPTRSATQTPWLVYVPVTTTPEPATITPLPTVTSPVPTKAPTRVVPTRPPATKAAPTAVPVAAAPTNTPVPACDIGTVVPTFPEDGAPRNTRADGTGGSAIIFKWTPPSSLSSETDPHVGYMLNMESKRGGQHVNGAVLYISANSFLTAGQQVVFDGRATSSLAAGDNAVVNWTVTIVKTSGGFNDSDPTVRPPDLINCGAPSQTMGVQLLVSGG